MKQKSKIIVIISPSFPPEIIREILLKLPVESLLRCKSVCKDWYSLISDTHFIKSHYTLSSSSSTNNNINYQHHRLVFSPHEERNNLISCPLYDVLFHKSFDNRLLLQIPLQRPLSRGFSIVGSCNGLLCLFVESDLLIYNPSTRICNALPFRRNMQRLFVESEWYSFGYDESTDDYKIVELSKTYLQTHPYFIIKGRIYSLKTGKWKNLADFSYGHPLNVSGIFSNGALHWVARDESSTHRIVSLDLEKETYGEFLQPEYDEDSATFIILGDLGECLCGLFSYDQSLGDLWVMKVYGVKDSWTKLASFSYLTDPWISLYPAPLFISNDGEVLFRCASRLVISNSKDSPSPQIEGIFQPCIVVESLASPFPPLALGDDNEI